KLDDLEYEYKEIKGDMIYFKDYADEVDKAMLNAKEKIRRQRKKIKELKKTMGGRQLWNRVTDTYKTYGVWFSDGGDMDAFLKNKDDQRMEEEVNRRLGEKGGQGNKGGKSGDSKGK
ncbi:unnamed protein product, partial [Symbiodinium sp. CCMP2456]